MCIIYLFYIKKKVKRSRRAEANALRTEGGKKEKYNKPREREKVREYKGQEERKALLRARDKNLFSSCPSKNMYVHTVIYMYT